MELSVVGVGIEDVPPYTVPVRVASEAETTWVVEAAVETDDTLREVVALSVTEVLEVGAADVVLCSEDVARELEVDGDAAVPGHHRASLERLRAVRELDPVHDGYESELVAIFVPARGHGPLHERGRGHHPSPEAELEQEQ